MLPSWVEKPTPAARGTAGSYGVYLQAPRPRTPSDVDIFGCHERDKNTAQLHRGEKVCSRSA